MKAWKFVKEGGYADRHFRNLIHEALKWKILRKVWLPVWEEITRNISKVMKDQPHHNLQIKTRITKQELIVQNLRIFPFKGMILSEHFSIIANCTFETTCFLETVPSNFNLILQILVLHKRKMHSISTVRVWICQLILLPFVENGCALLYFCSSLFTGWSVSDNVVTWSYSVKLQPII